MRTMQAVLFYGPMDIRIEQCAIPHPASGEVLVQVAAATTCGTDLKTYRRGHPLLFPRTPAGFGHEVAGIVSEVGAGVPHFHEGDAVVIANSAPCRACFYCRRGQESLCENLLFLNGAYAEYLLVPERIVRLNLYHIPPETSFVASALTEPLACALHGVEASGITADDTVVVLGSGPLGLLLASVAKLRGAHVIITGHSKERIALAQHFGADSIIDVSTLSNTEQLEAVRDKTEGQHGADVVIEAIGTPETWELAAHMARPGGLINFFGGCPSGTQIRLETRPIHYNELTIKGVFHHTPAYFAQALDLIVSKQIDIETLITARVPLASTIAVFHRLLQKQGVKYALIPPAFAQEYALQAIPE